MKFKGRLQLEQGLKMIHIAPLVNIIFLIVLFFMLIPAFTTIGGIEINLPKAVTSQAIRPVNIELLLTKDNVVYLGGKPASEDQLMPALKQLAGRDSTLLIKADRNASLGRLSLIWDMARQAGISRVSIATNHE